MKSPADLSLLLRRENVWRCRARCEQNRAPAKKDGAIVYVRDINATLPLWKERGHRLVTGLAAVSPRLMQMIGEFERALRGTPTTDAVALQARIRAVRHKQDLWHLRSDVYALVKQTYDRWEAQLRIEELDDLFDAAAHPRVPFAS